MDSFSKQAQGVCFETKNPLLTYIPSLDYKKHLKEVPCGFSVSYHHLKKSFFNIHFKNNKSMNSSHLGNKGKGFCII